MARACHSGSKEVEGPADRLAAPRVLVPRLGPPLPREVRPELTSAWPSLRVQPMRLRPLPELERLGYPGRRRRRARPRVRVLTLVRMPVPVSASVVVSVVQRARRTRRRAPLVERSSFWGRSRGPMPVRGTAEVQVPRPEALLLRPRGPPLVRTRVCRIGRSGRVLRQVKRVLPSAGC